MRERGPVPIDVAALDHHDPLAHLREHFEIPVGPDGTPSTYLVGNSLGAMPRGVRHHLDRELDRWSRLGVRGHFESDAEGAPWVPYHELLTPSLAGLVGAGSHEVTVMGALTVNLHLLMVSFYRPVPGRTRVLVEAHAFPSDHFAVTSQMRQRGVDPDDALVEVAPRPGEETIRPDDLLDAIDRHGETLAMVLLPGVQYYTGEVLPMADLAEAAHRVGATVGLDLAHAVGNVPLRLHDWDIDFAAWCSYKYLNAGPGAVAGCFVHERHHARDDLDRFEGWWATDRATRFEMGHDFAPIPTVEAWQVSNTPLLQMAALRASLEVFDLAGGMGPLREKSSQMSEVFDELLDERLGGRVGSITPRDRDRRGCQLSLRIVDRGHDGRAVFEQLEAAGVGCDWRFPDVIRVAPVPLYNTFADIARFVDLLDEIVR